MKILYLIPARSGSKEIPNKNIKNIKGKPLLAWSIEQALESTTIQIKKGHECRVIVSTDSELYASIATKYGAEVPFIRPSQYSKDTSQDYEFIKHAYTFLQNNKWKADLIIQLRPTQPCRTISLINKTIDTFISHIDNYTSLRTVSVLTHSPFKSYIISNNVLIPLFQSYESIHEPFNQCRQILPQCYIHNGYVDIVKPDTLQKYKSVTGPKIFPFVMDQPEFIDIDTNKDFQLATKLININ